MTRTASDDHGDALDTAGTIHEHDWSPDQICIHCGITMAARYDELIAQFGGLEGLPFSDPSGKPRSVEPEAAS